MKLKAIISVSLCLFICFCSLLLWADIRSTDGDIRMDTQNDGVYEATFKEQGSLGIGTATPAQKLHVVGNTYVRGYTFIRTRQGGSDVTVNSGNVALLSYQGNLFYDDAGDNQKMIVPNGGVWSISGGNVYVNPGNAGLGTSSPDKALHVIGTAFITEDLTVGGCVILSGALTVPGNVAFQGNLRYDTTAARPKRTVVLSAGGATPDSTNGPSQYSIDGVCHSFFVLDYPADTEVTGDSKAYWDWVMPDSYDGGDVRATVFWYSTDAGTVTWNLSALGVGPGTTWDAATGALTTVAGSSTAEKLQVDSSASFTPSWGAGEMIVFEVARDRGTGTLTGASAKLLRVKLEYSVNEESD